MKEISLTQGYKCSVDDECYENLSLFKWQARNDRRGHVYAYRAVCVNGKQRLINMAREIVGVRNGFVVDHVNGNTLDNQKHNLREATYSENNKNSARHKNSQYFYRGVYPVKNRNGWSSQISVNKKRVYLGYFKTQEDAARAYDIKAVSISPLYAKLNFPKGSRNG